MLARFTLITTAALVTLSAPALAQSTYPGSEPAPGYVPAPTPQMNAPAEDRAESRERESTPRDHAWRPGFGARVGGYGFRDPKGSDSKWETCRMNGFGVFGTLDANQYLFGELSLDFYHATPDVRDDGLDRLSNHALAAVGARMVPDFIISPYVQVGGGAEWTRLEQVETGYAENAVFPMAFVGLGADVNVTDQLKLGMNVRFLATMLPDENWYGSSETSGSYGGYALERQALEEEGSGELGATPSVASQAQFFVRYVL